MELDLHEKMECKIRVDKIRNKNILNLEIDWKCPQGFTFVAYTIYFL